MDKIRRRADGCAANGVNCCLIFGAHFRWDFMPLWGRLHELLRFIADELHQRHIVLFDHHSSVLVHRPRNREEALNIWRRNRHHIPFYPANNAAATWEFNGSRLNDWRMIDVETGQAVYLPSYNAEQFCMNNPAFREAYIRYVRQMRVETGIDGLMSDDGIFYADWRACACKYCRARFHKKYGRRLPPVSDATFWGNRRSEAFADWIDLRFETCGNFLVEIRKTLPSDFPFLSCCSSSDGYAMPAYGMSYQDFIRGCNLVLLEMAGSTPSTTGTWDGRLPSQMLHLGIAREHGVGCLGLGYGFFPDTAFFVWALNKFLGSDCWFSSLKGRLNASPTELEALADDSELVQEGYRWERAHPQLFTGEVDSDVAVVFSRSSRDHYGQCVGDYVSDFHASCLSLMRGGIAYQVVTRIPNAENVRVLILSSVVCLSAEEQRQLRRLMERGGTVIATGPTGHYDQRARPVARAWLEGFGVAVELIEPSRPSGFPPDKNLAPPIAVAQCRLLGQPPMSDGWFTAAVEQGRLLWRPSRISNQDTAAAVVALLRASVRVSAKIEGLPPSWRVRPYRDAQRLLLHALPAQVDTLFHQTLQNQFTRERVIEKLQFTPLTAELAVASASSFTRVRLHSPDLPAWRDATKSGGLAWKVDPAGVSRYFVLECTA